MVDWLRVTILREWEKSVVYERLMIAAMEMKNSTCGCQARGGNIMQ